jgi:hypothetical protein
VLGRVWRPDALELVVAFAPGKRLRDTGFSDRLAPLRWFGGNAVANPAELGWFGLPGAASQVIALRPERR